MVGRADRQAGQGFRKLDGSRRPRYGDVVVPIVQVVGMGIGIEWLTVEEIRQNFRTVEHLIVVYPEKRYLTIEGLSFRLAVANAAHVGSS